jgi:hypothetical protein
MLLKVLSGLVRVPLELHIGRIGEERDEYVPSRLVTRLTTGTVVTLCHAHVGPSPFGHASTTSAETT